MSVKSRNKNRSSKHDPDVMKKIVHRSQGTAYIAAAIIVAALAGLIMMNGHYDGEVVQTHRQRSAPERMVPNKRPVAKKDPVNDLLEDSEIQVQVDEAVNQPIQQVVEPVAEPIVGREVESKAEPVNEESKAEPVNEESKAEPVNEEPVEKKTAFEHQHEPVEEHNVAAEEATEVTDEQDLDREEEVDIDDEDYVPKHRTDIPKHQLKQILEPPIDFTNIETWMSSGGAEFDRIELVTYDGIEDHRGVHSSRALNSHEMVMKIPRKFIITNSGTRASEIGQRIENSLGHRDHYDQLYIACFLLEERYKGENSFWRRYIETLPSSFRNIPVNFNEEELAMMEGSYTLEMHESDTEELVEDYGDLCRTLPDFCERHSFEDYKWGRLAVMSRAFSLTIDGDELTALMPYADMINHDFDSDTTWEYEDDLEAGTLVTVDSVIEGRALSISYGNKGNERLLSYYGFAIDGNPYNEVAVYIGLPDDDPLLKKRVARSHNSDTEFYRLFHKFTGKLGGEHFDNAMALCRLSVATEEELDQMPLNALQDPLSINHEIKSLRFFQAAIEDALFRFPQSIHEDEELLQSSLLTNNQRNIILTRHGEKHVLHQVIDAVDKVIPLLRSKTVREFNRQRLSRKFSNDRDYLRALGPLMRKTLPLA